MNRLENRIPPPLVAASFALVMWLSERHLPNLTLDADLRVTAALTLLMLGTIFSLAGVIAFRRARTTVNPLKPETSSSLVDSGVYRITRNPMYAGFALWLLAWAVYLSSPLTLLGLVGFIAYMNRFQIGPEERALATLFGEDFIRYRARVRRWL